MKSYKRLILPVAIAVLILAVLAWLVFHGKKEKSLMSIDPQFSEYISAVTAGVISGESTIKVVLVEDYKGDTATRNEVIKNIFDFDPGISGTTRWADSRTIEFIPDKRLKSGQLFEATFKLKKVVKVPDEFGELHFAFSVIRQDFMVSDEGVRTYPGVSSKYFLAGTIKTSDVADNTLIEKVLTDDFLGKKLDIRWEHSSDRLSHRFIIDSIQRGAEGRTLNLTWNGSPADIEKKGNFKVEIPALGVFKVIDALPEYQAEQCVKIIFSDPVEPGQDLDGIITVSNSEAQTRFTIEDNIVKVYLTSSDANEAFTLDVSTEVKNTAGKNLDEPFSKEIGYLQNKPNVAIIGDGVIMPNEGKIVLPFKSVNLRAVDIKIIKIYENNIPQFLQSGSLKNSELYNLKRVGRPILKQKIDLVADHTIDYGRWNNFSVELSKLIKTEPGAVYQITLSFKKQYSLYPCTADSSDANEDENSIFDNGKAADEGWDDGNYGDEYGYEEDEYYDYYEYGDDYWENRDNPCHRAYYTNSNHTATCNVLASNLGIIAKVNKNNHIHVIVTDLLTTDAVQGAKVEVLDFQNQIIGSGSTGSDGIVDLKLPHLPALVVVKRGDERGYLTLHGGESLSLSTFDVSGEEIQKGLKGFIYGERGVWRPGDTLFLSFILEDKNKSLPPGHPVIFELYDPRGRMFKRLVKVNGLNGFYTFAVPTNDKVPTGFWNARVKAGGATFERSIRIETIKPNRLEINLTFNEKNNMISSSLQAKLHSQWLHGATAAGLAARITASLSKSVTSFAKFPGYSFDDLSRSFTTEEQEIFEGSLDNSGSATINTTLKPGTEAPGFLRASFTTKVFEEGGDFSIDNYGITLSPYDVYVGIRTPQDQWGYDMFFIDSAQVVNLASVRADGTPVSRSGLEISVYKMDWRWWWDASDDDVATFFANSYQNPVSTQKAFTVNGKGKIKLDIKTEGRYLIRVTDPAGHACSKVVYADWPWWRSRNSQDRQGASILNISPDKPKYKVGETAVISLPADNKGKVLVSIESGSKVISMFWADLKKLNKKPVVEVPITAEMAPNVFIGITLLQPHKNTLNDMPMRMYGYTPILVEDPSTILQPVLNLPKQVASEEAFNLAVKEKNGKPMTYTLAIVDEGLLGITRFKTPDPHPAFYAREALGIKTWDMYNLVFGAFGGKIEEIFGIGGDQELAGQKGDKNAERFKPVVKFLGPFTLPKGKTNKHVIRLPKYNGAVRVMVVAGQDGAYGACEQKLTVKNALMTTATLPRVLGPSETVTMPVNIFVDDASIKSVTVSVKSNNLLIPAGTASKVVNFARPGSGMAVFTFKVAEKTGVARVKVTVAGGKYKADYDIELDVRNPNPPVVEYTGTMIEPGKSWNQTISLPGMAGTNKAVIELSGMPPIDLSRHLEYLIAYPHGCIEQTTSSVFPQLFLDKIMDLSARRKIEIQDNIRAGLERLRLFQLSDGGFSYWPGSNYVSEWGTNYAGHFIIEAEKAGYSIPSGLKSKWVSFQKNAARNYVGRSEYSGDELTQAYRLYTLALAGAPEMGAMNRLRERATLSVNAKWSLAAAYMVTGHKEAADELTKGLAVTVSPYTETGGTFGSDLRDMAMMLETFTLQKDMQRGMILAENMSKRLSTDRWLSTQTTAYCLIAISDFAGVSGLDNNGMTFSYAVDGSSSAKVASKAVVYQIKPEVGNKQKLTVNVNNGGKASLFARVYAEGIPTAGKETDESSNLAIEVTYKDMKGNDLNPASIKQGTDFKAIIKVSNTGNMGYLENLALTQVVPSGWEIINTRMTQEAGTSSDVFDYQDIRDDRVLTYFNLRGGESKTFSVLLNATYRGTFYMPVISCEAMYDNRIYARKAGKWVKIE
jgi:alpha-2-macroglobulin